MKTDHEKIMETFASNLRNSGFSEAEVDRAIRALGDALNSEEGVLYCP